MRKYPGRFRLNVIKIREKFYIAIFDAYLWSINCGQMKGLKMIFSCLGGILRVAILGAANFFYLFFIFVRCTISVL